MANEISASLSLSFTKNGITETVNIVTTKFTMNGNNYEHFTMNVPMSGGGTAIPKSSISTIGWVAFKNLDGSGNLVQIMNQVGGSALIQVNAGEFGMVRFASGAPAPAALAITSSVLVDMFLIEN
jgi:hypothetical protein